jgi:hypothetical protein
MSVGDSEEEIEVATGEEGISNADMRKLAHAIWSEFKLGGNPNVPAEARKEMWRADRDYYVRLAGRVRKRLNRRGLELTITPQE